MGNFSARSPHRLIIRAHGRRVLEARTSCSESDHSGILAVLAILLPVLAFALGLLVVVWTARRLARFFRRDKTSGMAR